MLAILKGFVSLRVADLGTLATLRQKRQSRGFFRFASSGELVSHSADVVGCCGPKGHGFHFESNECDATHLRGLGKGGELQPDGDASDVETDGAAGAEGDAAESFGGG